MHQLVNINIFIKMHGATIKIIILLSPPTTSIIQHLPIILNSTNIRNLRKFWKFSAFFCYDSYLLRYYAVFVDYSKA